MHDTKTWRGRLFRVSAAVTGTVLLLLGMYAPSAFAISTVVGKWVVTTQVNSGSPVSFEYDLAHVTRGSVLVVQRQFGTANVWRTVAMLRLPTTSDNGKGLLPSLQQGQYLYRAYVTPHSGTPKVWRSAEQAVYSYAAVPFLTICQTFGGADSSHYSTQCGAGTVQVGDRLYQYAASSGAGGQYPSYGAYLEAQSTTCRSAHITFTTASGGTFSFGGGRAYLEVVRSDADPQYSSARQGVVGTLHAVFDGRPWNLEDAVAENAGNPNYAVIYYNGAFDCYTASGN